MSLFVVIILATTTQLGNCQDEDLSEAAKVPPIFDGDDGVNYPKLHLDSSYSWKLHIDKDFKLDSNHFIRRKELWGASTTSREESAFNRFIAIEYWEMVSHNDACSYPNEVGGMTGLPWTGWDSTTTIGDRTYWHPNKKCVIFVKGKILVKVDVRVNRNYKQDIKWYIERVAKKIATKL